jgi:hypothetical protein
MNNQLVLSLGVASIGATIGYMVGGSSSPVVSVAIPAIFGLVVTGIGLMQVATPNKDLLEFIKAHGSDAETVPEIKTYRTESKKAPGRIGLTLIVFSVAYLAAATLGAKVRIDNWLVTHHSAPAFPWASKETKPPTIEGALEWIALQHRLRDLGYAEKNILELYDIQVKEWKAIANAPVRAPIVQVDPKPAAQATPLIDPKPSAGGVDLDKYFKDLERRKGNPFAHQPPSKSLGDPLKDLNRPGVTNMHGRQPS